VKRFYKEAAIRVEGDGYAVTLDDRAMKTPARRVLIVPTAALARAVAEEWQGQGESVDHATLRLTRIVCTAIDRVEDHREEVIDHALTFGATDLTCYRAAEPAELVACQRAAWDPLLEWLEGYCQASLKATNALGHVEQSAQALERLRAAVAASDTMALSGLAGAVAISGSLVIGLGLREGRLDAPGAFAAAQVDESFQIKRWGEDDELTVRRRSIGDELAACAAVMALCRA
jgi:chaperone required for assembly of F1-ATPase